MKTSYLIALLAFLLCTVPINAKPATTENPNSKIAAAITIHNSTPSAIMGSLNLFSTKDLKYGITQIWQRDKSSSKVLPGIDLIIPCNNEHILTVYGDKTAVEELKTRAASMDVTPKQVQVKVELISLRPDEVKELGFDNYGVWSISKQQMNNLKDSIAKGNANLVTSPIISTINGLSAETIITSDSQSYRLCTLPIINADGTITILSYLSLTKDRFNKQEMSANSTVANNDTVLLNKISDPSKAANKILVFMTATVIN